MYVRTLGEFFSNPIAKLTLLHEPMPKTVHNQHIISVYSSTYTLLLLLKLQFNRFLSGMISTVVKITI